MKTIVVYGSLKNERYNHYLLEGCKLIGIVKVKGTLYKMGSYPALLEEGDIEYDAEVYEVPEDVYDRVQAMELGSGYREKEIAVLVDGEAVKAIIYYTSEELTKFCKEHRSIIQTY